MNNLAQLPINHLKDGDGDEDGIDTLLVVNIEQVSNGYVVIYVYESGDEIREVHLSKEDLLQELERAL